MIVLRKFSLIGQLILLIIVSGCSNNPEIDLQEDELSQKGSEVVSLYNRYMNPSRSSTDNLNNYVSSFIIPGEVRLDSIKHYTIGQLDSLVLLIENRYDSILTLYSRPEIYSRVINTLNGASVSTFTNFIQEYYNSGGGTIKLYNLCRKVQYSSLNSLVLVGGAVYVDVIIRPTFSEAYIENRQIECLHRLVRDMHISGVSSIILDTIIETGGDPLADAILAVSDVIEIIELSREYYDCIHSDDLN